MVGPALVCLGVALLAAVSYAPDLAARLLALLALRTLAAALA